MKRNEQISTIREAFNALPDLQEGWYDVKERLFDMNKIAEKRHRSGGSFGLPNTLSITDAAKYFTCKHLLDGWHNSERYTVDDILSVRNEVLYAQAYAKRFHRELAAWAANYTDALELINYSELMNHKAA